MPIPSSRLLLCALLVAPIAAMAGCGSGATVGAGSSATRSTATPAGVITATPSPASISTASASATPAATTTPTVTPSPVASSSAAPVAIASDSVFASIGDAGVESFTTAGTPIATYASSTGAEEVALDASGNTYVLSSSGFDIAVSRYAVGAQSPNATYMPTSPRPQMLFAGSNGTLVVAGASSDANGNPTGVYDFWDPGVTGAPSRTLTYPIETLGLLNGAIATDGTFYLPYSDSTNQVRYDTIAPGASAPTRTIVESIAPANTNFSASTMAVGSDGTLFVGEWTYSTPDTNAGLYVYPVSGSETHVTTGAPNPTGIGLDANANVYVSNSNANVGPDGNLTSDTVHQLSNFTPLGTSLTSSVTAGLNDPQDLAVDDDGTAYLVDFADNDLTTSPIEVVRPGATTAATFAATTDATNVVLYDGTTVRSTRLRSRDATHAHAHAASSGHALRFHRRNRR